MTPGPLLIDLLDRRVALRAEPGLWPHVEALYGAFPRVADADVEMMLGSRRLTAPGRFACIPDSPPERVMGLFQVFLTRWVYDVLGGGTLLHANALWDRASERLLIMAGWSGVGKSTLSERLLASGRFAIVSEDLVPLASDGRTVHGYPRARSRRLGEEEEPGGLPWPGLGVDRKVLRVYTPEELGPPRAMLDGATLVFLERDCPVEPEPPSAPQSLLLTVATFPTDVEEEARHLGTGIEVERREPFPLVRLGAGIDAEARMRLQALFDERGILLLNAAPARPHRPRPHEVALQPVLRRLTADGALAGWRKARVRPRLDAAGGPVDVLFAARALARVAGVYTLTVGGTPDESADALLEAADAYSSWT